MRVQSLGREGPLEEGIATHSSISCLKNPMDKGAWRATVHGVAKSRTWLRWLSMHLRAWIVPGGGTCFWASSRNILLLCLSSSEKAMAPHSSTLAWKIPWTEEPGGLQSMGSQRVGHDWANSLSLFTFKHWRRKWQPTPGFLPGESQGLGSLMGCCLWGRTESDTTEAT